MKIFLVFSFSILLFACNGGNNESKTSTTATSSVNGEQLFKINCAQCHKPTEELIGPPLKEVSERWPDKQLLYAFVRNSSEVIAKDDYAKSLFVKYNQSPMLPMPHLTDKDIDAILAYCNAAQ